MGVHAQALGEAFDEADRVFVLGSGDLKWRPESVLEPLGAKLSVAWNVDETLEQLLAVLKRGDHVVMMSNGSFQGLRGRLQRSLKRRDPLTASA